MFDPLIPDSDDVISTIAEPPLAPEPSNVIDPSAYVEVMRARVHGGYLAMHPDDYRVREYRKRRDAPRLAYQQQDLDRPGGAHLESANVRIVIESHDLKRIRVAVEAEGDE